MQDNEIVTALVALFSAFTGREQGKEPHHPVDPTQLREALGRLPGGSFQVGQRLTQTYNV